MASDTNNNDNTIIIISDDDGAVLEVEVYNYPHQDVKDKTKPCLYKSKLDIMIGAHERAIHLMKKVTKIEIKDEVVKKDT